MNERWNDRAIELQREADERRFRTIEDVIEALERLPTQMVENTFEVKAHGEHIEGLRDWMRDVEARLQQQIANVKTDLHEDIERVAADCTEIKTSQQAEQQARKQRQAAEKLAETNRTEAAKEAAKTRRTTRNAALVAAAVGLLGVVATALGLILGVK